MRSYAYPLSALALIILAASFAPAAQDIESLQKIYNDAKAKIDSAHARKLAGLGEQYIRQLEAQIEQAKNKGDLRGYKALVSEKERFAGEKSIPESSAIMKHIRSAEHDRTAEIIALSNKYVARLEKLKIALMQRDKIADAEAVDAEIKRTKFAVAVLEFKQPAPTAGTARAGGAPAPRSPSYTKGLVLHYDFNTRVTGTVKDLSGCGNDGKISGARWLSSGRRLRNGAIAFDGKDGKITVPDAPDLRFDKGLTVALWVKIDNDKRHQTLVAKYHVKMKQRAFALNYNDRRHANTPHRVQATVSAKGDPFAGGVLTTDMAVTKRTWHHVVLRFAPTDMRVYIDGKNHSGRFALGSPPRSVYGSNRPIIIGASEETGSQTLDGCIDDVMIWNRALSEEEIQQVYATQGK